VYSSSFPSTIVLLPRLVWIVVEKFLGTGLKTHFSFVPLLVPCIGVGIVLFLILVVVLPYQSLTQTNSIPVGPMYPELDGNLLLNLVLVVVVVILSLVLVHVVVVGNLMILKFPHVLVGNLMIQNLVLVVVVLVVETLVPVVVVLASDFSSSM